MIFKMGCTIHSAGAGDVAFREDDRVPFPRLARRPGTEFILQLFLLWEPTR